MKLAAEVISPKTYLTTTKGEADIAWTQPRRLT